MCSPKKVNKALEWNGVNKAPILNIKRKQANLYRILNQKIKISIISLFKFQQNT